MTVETFGCDFAWTKPDPTALRNAGYSFVLGYISNDASKDLSGAQIAAYAKAGLRVGLVYETTANRVLSGAAGGNADGIAANTAANSRGYAANAPLFYAVDFDAQPSDFATIAAYGNAFNLANPRPVGVYGSYAIVEHLVTPGMQPNQVGWQTAAWSSGLLSAKANLYQRAVHYHPLVVAANLFDEDVCTKTIQLHGGVIAPPGTTKPVPTPPPPPKPVYHRVMGGDTLTTIATRFHTTIAHLVSWNHLANPNLIYPGETLVVGWH